MTTGDAIVWAAAIIVFGIPALLVAFWALFGLVYLLAIVADKIEGAIHR